jgi:hypothetical protein
MADLKLNITDTTKVKQDVKRVITPVPDMSPKKAEAPTATKIENILVKNTFAPSAALAVPTGPRQRCPSNWGIKSLGDDRIQAESDAGDKFEGTIADFNKYLRS